MISHNKTNGLNTVKYTTSKTDNSVYNFAPLAYLRLTFRTRIYREILKFVGSLQISIGPYPDVFYDFAIFNNRAVSYFSVIASFFVKFSFSKFFKFLQKCFVIP